METPADAMKETSKVAALSTTAKKPSFKTSSSSAIVSSTKSMERRQQPLRHKQTLQNANVDDEIDAKTDGESPPITSSPLNSPYNSYLGGAGSMGISSMYGGGMMGMMPGMYGMGGMGMYGGLGGMGMYGGVMGSQWLFSLNQFLYGIQSVVFSLGQAVQIVGMNAQQVRYVYESAKGMIENALIQVNNWGKESSWKNLAEVLGSKKEDTSHWILGSDETLDTDGNQNKANVESFSIHDTIRKRRIAAFRWTLTLTASYFLYKTMRLIIRALIVGVGSSRSSRASLAGVDGSGRKMFNHYNSLRETRGGYPFNMNQHPDAMRSFYGGQRYDPYSNDFNDRGRYY